MRFSDKHSLVCDKNLENKMREITDIKEIQQIELEIFDKIHEFCMKRGLRYSLYGGTMIGAIRHKGFIPWDDDIDLAMPRPDYEIFCREFKAEGFSVHTHKNDPDYVYPFAKVYHEGTVLIEKLFPNVKACVYVDIFPFDGFPNDKKAFNEAKRSRRWNMRWAGIKSGTLFKKGRPFYKTLIRTFLRWCLWIFPKRFFLERFQRDLQKHGYEGNPLVADMTWGYGESQCIPAEGFETVVDVEFEGRKVKAMAGWETYLRSVFGDYMTPPPPEKRVPVHDTIVWRK